TAPSPCAKTPVSSPDSPPERRSPRPAGLASELVSSTRHPRPTMKNVLSIQSHVVFGHAGNSASEFPMRRLGVNVWPLNTVQFSNHTQYGRWTGGVVGADELQRVIEGIGAIGVLSRCNAVLS